MIVEYLAGSESALLAQSSTEWLGVVSGSAYLGATTNGTNVTVNYDTSASDCAGPFNRGERCSLSGGNTAGDGEAAYLVADQPIVVHAQDDGDGGEAVMFMPVNELSTEYVIPVDAEYIALASLNTHAVVVCEPGEIYPVECDAIALASDGTTPDKAKASGAPVLAAGTRVLSDEPFYAYYEYATMDESIALGPKQGRLNMVPPPTIGIAAEVEEFTP